MFLRILVFLCIYFTLNDVYSQLPAFPGAEGFGTNTPGGRGGRIIKVTNLHDGGEGSLRAAIEAEGPRIVIFSIGGIISLEDKLVIRNPYITIAGQTATGDGICIRGEGIQIATHDVVVRYLRVRPGDIDFGASNDWDRVDAIAVGGSGREVYNVVIDHCSLSWAVDENLDLWYNAHDVTIQNCIINEALNSSKHPKGSHGMGVLIGSKVTNISMHHNLLAHNNQRNPRVNGETMLDFRNNVIYNPGGTVSDFGNEYQRLKGQKINYVGNYIIKGKNTQIFWEINLRKVEKPVTKIFLDNNIGFSGDASNNNQIKIRYNDGSLVDTDSTWNWQNMTPFQHPTVTTYSPEQTFDVVLNSAGATLPIRDAVDRKVIRDVMNNEGGIVNRKRHFLEWPPYESGIAFLDSDNDGMPDHWEEAYNLNPTIKDDDRDLDKDGYTNIEEFLNGTNPTSSTEETPLATNDNFNQHLFPNIPFDLEQNYPNPFDTLTKIKFSIDSPSKIKLRIIREDGKEVSMLVNAFLYEGKYEVALDATGLQPGLYFINLSSGKKIKAVRAILK